MNKNLKVVAMIIFVTVIVSAAGCTGKNADTNSLWKPHPAATQAPAIVESHDANNLKDSKPAATQAPDIVNSVAANSLKGIESDENNTNNTNTTN
jgi:hypothetical protein